MTLVIAAAGPSFSLLVADRRLTDAFGRPVDDEANKQMILLFDGSVFAAGFTGLARLDEEPVAHWFADTVVALADDRNGGPVLDNLTERATERWRKLTIPRKHRRLTVAGAGFIGDEHGQPWPIMWRITNFENVDGSRDDLAWDAFAIHRQDASRGSSGHWQPIFNLCGSGVVNSPEFVGAWDAFRTSMERASRPEQAVHRSYAMIQAAHGVEPSVGLQANVSVVTPDGRVHVRYVTDVPRRGWMQPVVANLASDWPGTFYYGDVSHFVVGNHPFGYRQPRDIPPRDPYVGPRLPKSAPCWCGSRRKYKSCHRRTDSAWERVEPLDLALGEDPSLSDTAMRMDLNPQHPHYIVYRGPHSRIQVPGLAKLRRRRLS